ncbi:hypothetical protein LPB140_06970 [Sphingorhabdus lutea]|uniref:EAL domain-containing protein n=1 Tax=Sphingorhabdus lutea TaxID=1913578 RepID=A0A1L3JBR5_9SPHN|nr:EAL domain-containing protein [Sphingorhabdus lutea]APG62568.1 hypothetical protein LPB140_06970 [Sphingorhabdus lutea]
MQARVVIVDDQAINLRIYAQYIAQMGPGFKAICFSNPHEALEWLASEHVELLVVDYKMPEMNGAEFIRKLRISSANNDVPAIIITARKDRECRLAALDAGANDFLQSPVNFEEFRKRIIALLGRRNNQILQKKKEFNSDNIYNEQLDNRTKSTLEQIIDTAPIIINATDFDGNCLFMNAYHASFYNKHPDDLVGKYYRELLPPLVAQRDAKRDSIVFATQQEIPPYEEKIPVNGVDLTFHYTKSPLLNHDGVTIGVLTTGVDITARKFAEDHHAHLAMHDLLTGLPNRSLLGDKLSQSLEEYNEKGIKSALLLLDLDRFKSVNDTKGHQFGDALLCEVAERLCSLGWANHLVSRIGGDEFAIIANGINDIQEITQFCKKLLGQMERPFLIDDVEVIIGASIGVVIIGQDSNCPDDLLRLADLAMYDAKANGRNRFSFYSNELNQVAQRNARIHSDMRAALIDKQFRLEFQPIMDSATKKWAGLEALLRWDHPEFGLVRPDEFIEIANETGLINEIGDWVLDECCKNISRLSNIMDNPPKISVNVSPRQFEYSDICTKIINLIDKYKINPNLFVIEITEELLLNHPKRVATALEKLRAMGIGISIDDFGTGYSSLQYLRDLPATCLKIDKAFVNQIEQSETDRAIIATIVHLAHAFNMKVVAEGVETKAQADLLAASGCNELQGYFLSIPQPMDKLIPNLLADEGRLAAAS